jgi:hypothetical protein
MPNTFKASFIIITSIERVIDPSCSNRSLTYGYANLYFMAFKVPFPAYRSLPASLLKTAAHFLIFIQK